MKWILPDTKNEGSLIERILQKRGIANTDKYFKPSVNDIVPPEELYGAKDAAKFIASAIKAKKKIFIHGDFDVDGITATTIMWDFLYRIAGADALPYIPSRFDEGYGLSEDSINNIIEQGGSVIITVDCGIKDYKIVAKYKDKIDFVITDHHSLLSVDDEKVQDEKELIQKVGEFAVSKFAKAVVHPCLNTNYPSKEVCGAYVSWKTCWAIAKEMGIKFEIDKYIELVALGTVCDVMPLQEENRTIVSLGLDAIRKTKNVGLQSILTTSGIKPDEVKSYHFGYVIGPRLNASGRISHAMNAVRLLATQNESAALGLANELHTLNTERQKLTQKFLQLAEAEVIKQGNRKIYFIYGDEWPEGIVGLIAGKLTQKYNRPVLVASRNKDYIKGSARSIEGFNISDSLKQLSSHLTKFGGHSQAAGFTLPSSNAEAFRDELSLIAENLIKNEDLEKKLYIDAMCEVPDCGLENASELFRMEPFGSHNSQPLISLHNLNLLNYNFLGSDRKHVKMLISDSENNMLNSIHFENASNYSSLLSNSQVIDVAGYLETNTWNNNTSVQFKVVDMKAST